VKLLSSPSYLVFNVVVR